MDQINRSFKDVVVTGTKRKTVSPLASRSKEPNLDDEDIPDSVRDEVSRQLENIRALNSTSYIPNVTQPTGRPVFRATSEASFGSSWDKGRTNLVQIEFLSFNGQNFNITLTRSEILYVWSDILGVDKNMVYGVSMKKPPNKGLIASLKLKQEVQIDSLFQRADFSYNRGERKEDGSFDIITGRILGLRNPPPSKRDGQQEPQTPGFTRVNIYGLDFEIDQEKVRKWMEVFGEILEFDEIMDRELPELATGDISVKMKLKRQIPCFLPMYGKRIRVAYRGMSSICSNCFAVGHFRKDCRNDRVQWLDYVKNLRSTGRFEDELFGRWIGILRAQRPETFEARTTDRLEHIPEEETEQTMESSKPTKPTIAEDDALTSAEASAGDENEVEKQKERSENSNDLDKSEISDTRSEGSERRSIIGSITGYFRK